MDTQVLEQCMAASFANTPFPAVVARLAENGVTSYTADLMALRKTYYNSGSRSHDEAMPLADPPAIASAFDSERVAATVKAIQRSEIGYAEFLRRIMAGRLLALRGVHRRPQGHVFRPRRRVLHGELSAAGVGEFSCRKFRKFPRNTARPNCIEKSTRGD